MSKYFGKTWWGQQWLNSLANIDFSNRLPRGSTYARNGSVSTINIEENHIKAKVRGSRPKPYDVTVIISPFLEGQVVKLVRAIGSKPVIVSKLLNRELDAEILKIAERLGLKVFPKQWTDFKMQCSCPDWAVPCKHLAAVIYKISAEIDNNPFLVFSLHKVNLAEELKKQNIFISEENMADIPRLKDLFFKKVVHAKRSGKRPAKRSPPQTGDIDERAFEALDFSGLRPIYEPLIQLLPDTPAFYQNAGNFKEKYEAALQKVVRNSHRIITGKISPGELIPMHDTPGWQPANGHDISGSLITHHTKVCVEISGDGAAEILVDDKKTASMQRVIPELWGMHPGYMRDFQPSIVILQASLLLAFNLLANGAVVPQLIRFENNKFAIRWIPALLSKEVKQLVSQLQDILPSDILRFKAKPGTLIDKDAAVHMLSAWLNMLVQDLAENRNQDVFLALFFKGYAYAFNAPGQQALSGGIQVWLQRYYITQGKYKPAIVVEELQGEKFQVSITMQEANKPMESPVALSDILGLKKYEKQRFEMLRSLAQLSSFIPGLDEYINSKNRLSMVMNTAEFAPFLMQAIPAIQLLDINILLPKSLKNILRPRATVRIKQKAKEKSAFLRLDKLLDFDWQVAIGDTVMDEETFKKLLRNSEGLIKYKSNYIYVSRSDLERLHKHFASPRALSTFEILRTALSNEYYGAKISLSHEVEELIRQLTQNEEVSLPPSVNATLRPYQQRGYSWLYRNARIGFGSLLADDMGLGKTLQVITTLLKFKQEQLLEKAKALVIAPTGLLTNWQAELQKFAPTLTCKLYHGTSRILDADDRYDILLTSYGVARSDAGHLKIMKWHIVIIDEAQNIKNYETAQSKAVKGIPANSFIAMSGTPVENRLSELWSIMDFSNRGFLGGLQEFKEHFITPIQNQHDKAVAEKLKRITSPFLMRRMKSDKSIINDLPDKVEIDSYCNLVKEQASLYEKTLHKALEAIEEIKTSDRQSLFQRQGLVLQMILALKQICNHPTQFLKNNVLDASLSGKVELLFDKLESITESNEKVLIFTQFTEMGTLLKHFITERFGEEPLYYHGGSSINQRKQMVNAFQTDPADKIFILSLKAAGTGLNLTAATHVIHYDLWWNPAVEAQATDRAYRIGQKSNVMVHRFITKGTFEERINAMIQSKKALADLTVASGETWIGNLSNKELKDIFELG